MRSVAIDRVPLICWRFCPINQGRKSAPNNALTVAVDWIKFNRPDEPAEREPISARAMRADFEREAQTAMRACSPKPGEAPMRSISLLTLLCGALCGCANAPGSSPRSLDVRTLCQQQAQASASAASQTQKDAYFDQCMIASSKEKPKAEQEKPKAEH
jgi:hypothetical protein